MHIVWMSAGNHQASFHTKQHCAAGLVILLVSDRVWRVRVEEDVQTTCALIKHAFKVGNFSLSNACNQKNIWNINIFLQRKCAC